MPSSTQGHSSHGGEAQDEGFSGQDRGSRPNDPRFSRRYWMFIGSPTHNCTTATETTTLLLSVPLTVTLKLTFVVLLCSSKCEPIQDFNFFLVMCSCTCYPYKLPPPHLKENTFLLWGIPFSINKIKTVYNCLPAVSEVSVRAWVLNYVFSTYLSCIPVQGTCGSWVEAGGGGPQWTLIFSN